MNTTLISNENNEAKFSIDFTAEEFSKAVNDSFRKNRKKYPVDGFRKGKAPRKLIERFYGEMTFYDDAVNELFRSAYPGAVEELDLEVIDNPHVDFSEIKDGEPLTMTFTVPLYPTLNVENYFGMDVEQTEQPVTEEDVDRVIEGLQKRNARMVSVDREAQKDDTVNLDYAGFVGDDQFEGGTAEKQDLKLGSGMFIPGFEDQLVGAKKGDQVDVTVTFPEEYQAAELAGKEAVFHCTINDIKEEQLPELDDEFAKDISEFDTLEEVRADQKKQMEEERENRAVVEAKNRLVDQLFDSNKQDVPRVMVEDEMDAMLREFEQQLGYQGLNLDAYLKYTKADRNQFREELRADATKRVTSRALLRAIAAKENIEVSEDDLNARLEEMAKGYSMNAEDFRKAIGQEMERMVRTDLVVEKAVDAIYDHANVTKVEPKKPEEEAAPETAETAETPENDAE